MDKQDGLSQQLRELRATEDDLRHQLVDPVSELLVQDEKLQQLLALAPDHYSAARAMMTEVVYLRHVIRDLLVPFIETQTQIRRVEAELRRAQAPSEGIPGASHPMSSPHPPDLSKITNGHGSKQNE